MNFYSRIFLRLKYCCIHFSYLFTLYLSPSPPHQRFIIRAFNSWKLEVKREKTKHAQLLPYFIAQHEEWKSSQVQVVVGSLRFVRVQLYYYFINWRIELQRAHFSFRIILLDAAMQHTLFNRNYRVLLFFVCVFLYAPVLHLDRRWFTSTYVSAITNKNKCENKPKFITINTRITIDQLSTQHTHTHPMPGRVEQKHTNRTLIAPLQCVRWSCSFLCIWTRIYGIWNWMIHFFPLLRLHLHFWLFQFELYISICLFKFDICVAQKLQKCKCSDCHLVCKLWPKKIL